MSRLSPLLLSLALLAAPSTRAADNSQAMVNVLPFDLAVCFVQPAPVEQPVNAVTFNGLWILAGPLVQDCLVDSRHTVPGKSNAFKVTLGLSENGTTRLIESDGLTAAGKKCIDDAVGKVSPPIAPLPAGSKAVVYTQQMPEVPANLQVRFGVNESSDVAGTVRLAMPSMCSCFEPFKAGADPVPISLKVQLTPAPEKFKRPDGTMPKPVEVTVGDGPAAPVKACIAEKLSALTYPPTKSDNQFVVPYEFRFLNAVATSQDVSALSDTAKFSQLDVMDVPRLAAAQLEQARLDAAGARYNALVKEYQALSKSDPKKAHGMLKELVSGCKKLVAEHDAYIAVLQEEAKLRQEQLTLTTALKAKDPAWTNAEAAVRKAAGESESLVGKARESRASDEKVCPKVRL
jgi:hypothetical protein